MNINNGSQNLKKFMKETFATRSVDFDFQGGKELSSHFYPSHNVLLQRYFRTNSS